LFFVLTVTTVNCLTGVRCSALCLADCYVQRGILRQQHHQGQRCQYQAKGCHHHQIHDNVPCHHTIVYETITNDQWYVRNSLRDQLAENKEKKDEDWKSKNNMFRPPAAPDEDEFAFIQDKELEKRQLNDLQRQRDTFEKDEFQVSS
jgi:hypothetical protein